MITHMKGTEVPSEDGLVWRYISLSSYVYLKRFVEIFEKEALFFPTIAKLRQKDPFEGLWTTFVAAQEVDISIEGRLWFLQSWIPYLIDNASRQLAVSCWHVNDRESKEMWNLYVPNDAGVALQTSFGRLKASFRFLDPDWPTYGEIFESQPVKLEAGQVKYVDSASPPMFTNSTRHAMLKSNYFQHEGELRISAKLFPILGVPQPIPLGKLRPAKIESLVRSEAVLKQVKGKNGVYFPVDVNNLIENIYIAPNAPAEVAKTMEKLVVKYKLSASLCESSFRR